MACALADAEATVAFGEKLGRLLHTGQLVTLCGTLGAGKTTLCRGIAAGMGVVESTLVTSPTYALMHEYPASEGFIVHIDAYRLAHAVQAQELGLEEGWLRRDALVLIEWAERLGALLPPPDVQISLQFHHENGAQGRVIEVLGPKALCDGLSFPG